MTHMPFADRVRESASRMMNWAKSNRGRTVLALAAIVLVIVPLAVTASWFVTQTMIDVTSGEAFCASCHTMEPMAKAYREDVHGGKSAIGVKAKCVECHLPHDNNFVYLVAKARIGIHDVWAQTFYNLDKIDWEAKRKYREHFVYDSGCLHCHSNLQDATLTKTTAFVAHKPYFLGEVKDKCVTCHENVGHKNLSAFLKPS